MRLGMCYLGFIRIRSCVCLALLLLPSLVLSVCLLASVCVLFDGKLPHTFGRVGKCLSFVVRDETGGYDKYIV